MKMTKILIAAVTFLLLTGPFSAQANIIYDWAGTYQPIVPPGSVADARSCLPL
jgi:hypothetical protein